MSPELMSEDKPSKDIIPPTGEEAMRAAEQKPSKGYPGWPAYVIDELRGGFRRTFDTWINNANGNRDLSFKERARDAELVADVASKLKGPITDTDRDAGSESIATPDQTSEGQP